jgi:hypothetical protein
MTAIVHITPGFLPQINGLGDYARLLATELKQGFGFESQFVVGDPEWSCQGMVLPFPVTAVRARGAGELLRELDQAETLILHYVGYGYHQRGAPFWINRAIRRWKQQSQKRQLIVVFHELWATGPPWKSEFYLSLFQRHLIVELYRLCDAAMTSAPIMYRMLEAILPGKTAFQPIPSNFPTMPLDRRTLHRGGPVRVIAFGQEASRLQGVRTHEKLLRALHREGLLARVNVVGQGAAAGGNPSGDVRLLRSIVPAKLIAVAPDVSPERGAELLAQADLFLSYYPSEVLCKSGALMAALGCGCVPVLPEAREAAPLVEGRELLACDGSATEIRRIVEQIRAPGLAALSEAGWKWYDRNASWPVVTATMARLLQNSLAKEPVCVE